MIGASSDLCGLACVRKRPSEYTGVYWRRCFSEPSAIPARAFTKAFAL